MKKLLIPILLLVSLFACEEKQDQKKQEAAIRHIPESYEEEVEDTLLNGGVQLMLKRYALMEKGYEITHEYEEFSEKIFFHDYAISFTLKEGDKTLSQKVFEKDQFPNMEIPEAIIHACWFESYDPDSKVSKLRTTIVVPDSDFGYLYEIQLDAQGKDEIILVEEL